MPNHVDGVLEGRGRAVVRPHHLLVGIGLGSRKGSVEGPCGSAVSRLVSTQPEVSSLNADSGRPRRPVSGPVDCGIGVQAIVEHERQRRLAPSGTAVGRRELCLPARINRVGGRDDLTRVIIVHPNVGLAAGSGLRTRDR